MLAKCLLWAWLYTTPCIRDTERDLYDSKGNNQTLKKKFWCKAVRQDPKKGIQFYKEFL